MRNKRLSRNIQSLDFSVYCGPYHKWISCLWGESRPWRQTATKRQRKGSPYTLPHCIHESQQSPIGPKFALRTSDQGTQAATTSHQVVLHSIHSPKGNEDELNRLELTVWITNCSLNWRCSQWTHHFSNLPGTYSQWSPFKETKLFCKLPVQQFQELANIKISFIHLFNYHLLEPTLVPSTVLETLGYMDGLNTEPAWVLERKEVKLYLRAARDTGKGHEMSFSVWT